MNAARKSLSECARGLEGLLSALDSDADARAIAQLSENSRAAFDALAQAMAKTTAAERLSLEDDLAGLRRWSALVAAAAQSSRACLAGRLSEVQRAREVLAALDARSAGDSCDIAG